MKFLNFWPFKRMPVQTMAEHVANLPDVECGNKEEHYLWEHFEGMTCPKCAGIRERRRKLADEDRLATKIAAAVVERMKSMEVSK